MCVGGSASGFNMYVELLLGIIVDGRLVSTMDLDTTILLVMTGCAYCWFVSFGILEQRREIKAEEQEKIDRYKRAERVKKLFGRN